MADATDTAPEGITPPAETSGAKKLLPILLVVLGGLIFGGASGFFMLGPTIAKKVAPSAADVAKAAEKAEAAAASEGEAAGAEAKVFLLDNMVLNPAGSSGQRFLLVSIAIRLKDATAEADLKARDAEIRDALLRVLGSKHVEELADITQREKLKEELRTTLHSIVKPGTVKGLYFPQFVIQ